VHQPQSGFGTLVVCYFVRFCDERNPQGAAGVWLAGHNQDAPLAHVFSQREGVSAFLATFRSAGERWFVISIVLASRCPENCHFVLNLL
jgi:hypothetical protein